MCVCVCVCIRVRFVVWDEWPWLFRSDRKMLQDDITVTIIICTHMTCKQTNTHSLPELPPAHSPTSSRLRRFTKWSSQLLHPVSSDCTGSLYTTLQKLLTLFWVGRHVFQSQAVKKVSDRRRNIRGWLVFYARNAHIHTPGNGGNSAGRI